LKQSPNRDRFQRQISLPEIGVEGQKRIEAARILLIGAGGLASSASYYLAAAGVGTLGIVDGDRVELSNLNRQILHNPSRIGKSKVISARDTLTSFNEIINIQTYLSRIENALELADIILEYDLVIDCTDNYSIRNLVNEVCIKLDKIWIYGAIFGFEGQVMTFGNQGPCYRCLYASTPKPETATPVIGITPGIIGIIQATEALKLILGQGKLLIGRLLYVDLLEMAISEFVVRKDRNCKVCGKQKTHPSSANLG
jgi:molybdopterin/thiamine biosynthesis adenylyltransferase